MCWSTSVYGWCRMDANFGRALRRLREACGLTLGELARKTFTSKAGVGHIETGFRTARPEFAGACDEVLGTTPLLSTLLGIREEDDDVKRRALLTVFGTAVGIGAATGSGAFAEALRLGLLDAVGAPADWDAVVDGFQRRLFLEPSPQLGDALLGQILVGRQAFVDSADGDALRGTALLSLMYGLWLGDQGRVPEAHNWYRTSTILADRSGDLHARTYIRGRSATRGMYEGMAGDQVRAGIGEALALSRRPTLGALEAHAASVQLAALTGDASAGRVSVRAMWEIANKLPAVGDGPGPAQRAASFQIYLEGRAGTLKLAKKAFEEASPILRSVPLWYAEAQVYYGRAMVRAGDVDTGISYALVAIRRVPFASRVVRMGVSDLLNAVPAGYGSEMLDALRQYAAAGPGPWEAIAA